MTISLLKAYSSKVYLLDDKLLLIAYHQSKEPSCTSEKSKNLGSFNVQSKFVM